MSEYAIHNELIVYVPLRTVMIVGKNAPNDTVSDAIHKRTGFGANDSNSMISVQPSITEGERIQWTNQHHGAIYNLDGCVDLIPIKLN